MVIPVEVETALLVVSDSPDMVADDLARMSGVDDFLFLEPVSHEIRDTYVDRRERSLEAKRIAWRVREVDGATLLTVKAGLEEWSAGQVRFELEAPWSPGALRQAVAELRSRGVAIGVEEAAEKARSPIAALASIGFEPIQVRETARTARPIVPRSGPDARPLADLAIDRVTYRFPTRAVRLHEVEVEARPAGSPQAVERIVRSLLEEKPSLQPWPHSKLVTGKTIKALLEAGQLNGLIGADNVLTIKAVRRLDAYLAGRETQI